MDKDYFKEALSEIVFYNVHEETLKEWKSKALEAKAKGKFFACPITEYHTEIHCIWEMFVVRFGSWGSSVRTGWVEDIDGFISMVDEIIKEAEK